jgi:hypothetical protein
MILIMFSVIFLAILWLDPAHGHMQLYYPAPLKADNNPHAQGDIDPDLMYPYGCCGRMMQPSCRGHMNLLGTPKGAATASWEAGSKQNWTIKGIGNHWGGSCQVGFSIDKGKTFQVATSYEGNCPHRYSGNGPNGQAFNFTVPHDIPLGEAIFAWTWVNREQEFNMNCAVVNITAPAMVHMPLDSSVQPRTSTISMSTPEGNGSTVASDTVLQNCVCPCSGSDCMCRCPKVLEIAKPQDTHKGNASMVLYAERPSMLMVDVDNGCVSPRTTAELKYPNPGPEVVKGDGVYPLELPTPRDICGY